MQGIARAAFFREPQGVLPTTLVLSWCSVGWLGSFALMASQHLLWNALGVLVCAHGMLIAAYMIHEAAHQSVLATPRANAAVGECLSFIAGASYVSFERIRHMHMRHHRDRVDLACFDHQSVLRAHRWLRRLIQIAEWAYLPATEVLLHVQLVWRPMSQRSQRRYLPRVLAMLLLRGTLWVALALWSLKSALLYLFAYALLLHVLNFFDAFHHTFEQHFVAADQPVPGARPDREYEMAHTYSNLLSVRWPWANTLILNFCYHNAHHERASAPWYRLRVVHRAIYGEQHRAVLPLRELLWTWHRNRVSRVDCEDYGLPGEGSGRADRFIGVHGVSFLTVV
ncbi:MAG TPA: fatty acid desaturase [Steroidobacteraceae bacterium]|jgi:fatty acid desaturase|nr:fatty acid desaturase [Steroidobacteraceae bacterium]